MINFPEIDRELLTTKRTLMMHSCKQHLNVSPFYVLIRAIRTKRGKKSTMNVHGVFVKVKGEGEPKILLPVCDFISNKENGDIFLNEKFSFILGTNYGKEVVLSNPRLVGRTNYVVCDFDTINKK